MYLKLQRPLCSRLARLYCFVLKSLSVIITIRRCEFSQYFIQKYTHTVTHTVTHSYGLESEILKLQGITKTTILG